MFVAPFLLNLLGNTSLVLLLKKLLRFLFCELWTRTGNGRARFALEFTAKNDPPYPLHSTGLIWLSLSHRGIAHQPQNKGLSTMCLW
jgi:hypothetical protein